MSSIRTRDEKLFFDLRVGGVRCREMTSLQDSPANRKKMQAVLTKIEEAQGLGIFEYRNFFPNSPNAAKVLLGQQEKAQRAENSVLNAESTSKLPTFSIFSMQWKSEKAVEWRKGYRDVVDNVLSAHLLPVFGAKRLDEIGRAEVMAFRASLGQKTIRSKGVAKHLAPTTMNRIIGILGMVMAEAAQRYEVTNPCQALRRLKQPKTDIYPFAMDEVLTLIEKARADYADYFRVRFFTGLRSGEVHGLKWDRVDFDRRLIRIRETFQKGRTEYTKTDGSQRDVQMSQPVFDALKRQESATKALGGYVFCNRKGQPIDNHNFVHRVWNPLLRHLGYKMRPPYQMRHTSATLWLAAGENPEWIARQLGHTSTRMLFAVYSRFVPNLTRMDGSAFDRLLTHAVNGGTQVAANDPDLGSSANRVGGKQ